MAPHIAKLDAGTDARRVAHDVSDVILLVHPLEEVSLRSRSEYCHIVTTVSLGS